MANTLPKKYPGTPAYDEKAQRNYTQQTQQNLPQKYPGTPAYVNAVQKGQSPQGMPETKPGSQAYLNQQRPQQAPRQAQATGQNAQGYQPSAAVTAAQQTLQQIQAQKPQGYESKYGAQLQGILDQIQNPGQFKYEFNGDNLFKAYADQFTQKGKQAMLDTMGKAAGLTGGYGNTFAQAAGQQAYQQHLLDLYNVGLDLRDRAYGQHRDELADQKDLLGIMQGMDDTDYGRYQDALNQWLTEEGNAYDRAADERNFDHGAYKDQLDENFRNREQGWRESTDQRDFDEAVRQANLDEAYRNRVQGWNESTDQRDFERAVLENDRNFDWNKSTDERDYLRSVMENDRNYYTNYAAQMLANGEMPSADILAFIGLSEEDARKLLVEQVAGGGPGGPNLIEGDVQYFPDGTLRIVKDGKYVPVDPSLVTADKIKYGVYDASKAGKTVGKDFMTSAKYQNGTLWSDIGINPETGKPINQTGTTKSTSSKDQWALKAPAQGTNNNSSIVLKTAEEIKKILGNSGGLKYAK